MSMRHVLLATLALGIVPSLTMAQTATTTPPTTTPATPLVRSPNQGDPVAQPTPPRPRRTTTRAATTRAANSARTDRQAPGTENGNQPDRAMAGGGAR